MGFALGSVKGERSTFTACTFCMRSDPGPWRRGRGRFDEAFPHHAETVRQSDRAFHRAVLLRHGPRARRGDLDAAARFSAALVRFPAYASARLHLGMDLKRLGRPGEAREELQQALQGGLSDEEAACARRELAGL